MADLATWLDSLPAIARAAVVGAGIGVGYYLPQILGLARADQNHDDTNDPEAS